MRIEKAKKGQLVAEKIRKALLNIDLRLVYASGQAKIAEEDFNLNAKLGGQINTKKALRSKAKYECYKIYIDNINKIKGEITMGLDAVLSRYTPRYKQIRTMYFLEQASIDEIANKVCYSKENVNKIVLKLKLDLCENYEVDSNDR